MQDEDDGERDDMTMSDAGTNRNHGLGLDENIETNECSSALVASKTRIVRTCVNSSRRYCPLNDSKALLPEYVGVSTRLRED